MDSLGQAQPIAAQRILRRRAADGAVVRAVGGVHWFVSSFLGRFATGCSPDDSQGCEVLYGHLSLLSMLQPDQELQREIVVGGVFVLRDAQRNAFSWGFGTEYNLLHA